jgi:group I intron endonuclease
VSDKVYSIYVIVNTENTKVYVGQTYQALNRRWKQHKIYSKFSKEKIYQAIRKYGIEKFNIKLICYVPTSEEADLKERELIKHYDSIKNGYNIQDGGRFGFKMTEETKLKISIKNKGKKRSEETKEKIRRKTRKRKIK